MFEDTLHLSWISLDNIEEWTKQSLHTLLHTAEDRQSLCRLCRNGEYMYTESTMDIDTLHMHGFMK